MPHPSPKPLSVSYKYTKDAGATKISTRLVLESSLNESTLIAFECPPKEKFCLFQIRGSSRMTSSLSMDCYAKVAARPDLGIYKILSIPFYTREPGGESKGPDYSLSVRNIFIRSSLLLIGR